MPWSHAVSVISCQTASVLAVASAGVRPVEEPSRRARTRVRQNMGSKGISRTSTAARTTASTMPAGVPVSVGVTAPGSAELPHSPCRRIWAGQLSEADGVAGAAAEASVSGWAGSAALSEGASGTVYDGVEPRVGVGSKRVHPTPSKYSSGQACASRRPTDIEPSDCAVPGVKPTATRAGIPSVRAIAAMVNEKWTQKPRLSLRKRPIAALPVPEFTEVSYVKPPSEAK